MAGHSHWAQIRHKKAIVDKKKSQLISKLINLILTSGKDNPNPETNPKLKTAIERAKEFGVSQEVIERNLKKLREKENSQLEEIILEAYGPNGTGFLIKCLTDNKNRTINDIKSILNKNNAKLAEPGSVMWLFNEYGVIEIPKSQFQENLLENIIGMIEDFKEENERVVFYVQVGNIYKLREFLEKLGIVILSTEIQFIPETYVKIENEEEIKSLVEKLLGYHDVYEVYINVNY